MTNQQIIAYTAKKLNLSTLKAMWLCEDLSKLELDILFKNSQVTAKLYQNHQLSVNYKLIIFKEVKTKLIKEQNAIKTEINLLNTRLKEISKLLNHDS